MIKNKNPKASNATLPDSPKCHVLNFFIRDYLNDQLTNWTFTGYGLARKKIYRMVLVWDSGGLNPVY